MAEFFSRRILNILAEILLSTDFNTTATDRRFGRFFGPRNMSLLEFYAASAVEKVSVLIDS